MEKRECIILAGGLGTRLQQAVPDLPKAMAPVAGRPFISYVIDYFRMQGVSHFIFSLGFRSDAIEEYLKSDYASLDYKVVTEEKPLGTGGGIQLALRAATTEHVIVANGDTLFRADIYKAFSHHLEQKAECSLLLKPMQHFDRYGKVDLDESNRITGFREKSSYEEGLINGGIYIVNRKEFLARELPASFSFEKDYLEKFLEEGKFFGTIHEGYFIDIGIPEDYLQAQADLSRPVLDLKSIDKSWTLFLDRDGVINVENPGNYILNTEGFVFEKDVPAAFRILQQKFGKLFVVSNQRGVSKGLMTEDDLQSIHMKMVREIEGVGATIEKIYYCTDGDDRCFNRKPNPGMALQALKEYPEIDPAKTIMVGNKPSDMKFGRAAGFFTVFVKTTNPHQLYPHPDIDLVFDGLSSFAQALES